MIKVLFMGRKAASAGILSALYEMDNVEVVGVLTDSHLEGSPTTEVAKKLNLDLYTLETANEAVSSGALIFDIGVSVLYWRRINEELIAHPKYGVINFHPALLPQYKGTAGYNLAILDSLDRWGITAHYVDKDIDTGGIIEILDFPIDSERETAQSLESKTMSRINDFVLDVFLKAVTSSELLPVSDNVGGRYVSRQEMEAMKEIKEGDDIDRKVRAFWFPPYTGAFIKQNGLNLTLVNEQILTELAPAGTTSLFVEKVDG